METYPTPSRALKQRVRELIASSKARREQQAFVLEGVKLLDCLADTRRLELAILSGRLRHEKPLLRRLQALGVPLYTVPYQEFRRISGLMHPAGLLVVAALPQPASLALLAHGQHLAVLLDGIQDPGNLGTIVRTCYALGASACLLHETCDPFNLKCVRASAGMILRQPLIPFHSHQLPELARLEVSLWAADCRPDAESIDGLLADIPDRLLLCMGSEGSGVSAPFLDYAKKRVRIPLARQADSLNVAVAAGILAYHLRLRQREKLSQ